MSRRGISLKLVFALVGVLMVVASAISSLYLSTLNFTQSFSNGDMALNEAEAGLSELMARLPDDNRFGMADEEIRGTVTPGLRPGEAYHVLTFRQGAGFPHSTNNLDGTRPSGSLGRTIPMGTLHAVSTGFCRGQYRTVEAVIQHPPFPFGLATSGSILSRSPLIVRGVSSTAQLLMDRDDRPGHVVCNAAQGVEIQRGPSPSESTYISGFIRSVGPVKVEPPAEIRCGVREYADPSDLPLVNVQSYRNRGEEGVVNILQGNFGSQVMDVMYYSDHDLRYDGSVHLKNAFLYVDGDLEITGGVTGVGALVVDGNLTLNGGASLSSQNRLAMLCSGTITLKGGGNHLQGLLYARGGLDAENVTVVGSAVVNSGTPGEGGAVLDRVVFVADEAARVLQFTSSSSSMAETQNSAGQVPFPIDTGSGSFPWPAGLTVDGWGDLGASGDPTKGAKPADLTVQGSPEQVQASLMDQTDNLWQTAMDGSIMNPTMASLDAYAQMDPGVKPIFEAFAMLWVIANEAQTIQQTIQRLTAEIAAVQAWPVPADDPNTDGDEAAAAEAAKAAALAELGRQMNEQRAQLVAKETAFRTMQAQAVEMYMGFIRTHAAANGTYNNGWTELNVIKDYRFDVNSYLPASEQYRVTYWHVSGKRL
ncbi:MAG: hypothetical protein AB1758_00330 [Candidatus Eremiobacterota bacterium]